MIINPVTVKLGRHEWESIVRLLGGSLTRLDPKSKRRVDVEHWIHVIEAATTAQKEAKIDAEAFSAFWSQNQHLLLSEARAAFRATKEANNG